LWSGWLASSFPRLTHAGAQVAEGKLPLLFVVWLHLAFRKVKYVIRSSLEVFVADFLPLCIFLPFSWPACQMAHSRSFFGCQVRFSLRYPLTTASAFSGNQFTSSILYADQIGLIGAIYRPRILGAMRRQPALPKSRRLCHEVPWTLLS
jgi:hypothetical protein